MDAYQRWSLWTSLGEDCYLACPARKTTAVRIGCIAAANKKYYPLVLDDAFIV